jgi:single-strand DNA-binding protein
MSIAKVTILGNVGGSPESRYTPSGAMNVTFSVAVNHKRGDTENTMWFRVTAWGKLAEVMDRLTHEGALGKGREVLVIGDLNARDYQAADGTSRTSLDVSADTIRLAGSREQARPDAPLTEVPF